MEKLQGKAIVMLESLKEGLENLECVLQQCMPDGDWGLFEENRELQSLWRRFCDDVYQGKVLRAVITADRIFQFIEPKQVATNFWLAVKRDDYFPFEKNRATWETFKQNINSGDGIRTVRAIESFIEKTLAYLNPPDLLHTNLR